MKCRQVAAIGETKRVTCESGQAPETRTAYRAGAAVCRRVASPLRRVGGGSTKVEVEASENLDCRCDGIGSRLIVRDTANTAGYLNGRRCLLEDRAAMMG